MSIANNIRALREGHNMTQEKLGDLLGLSRSAIAQWEKGINEPRMGNVEKMAQIFGVPKSSIVDDDYAVVTLRDVPPGEDDLVRIYAELNDANRSALLATARALLGSQKSNSVFSEEIA